MRGNSPCQLDLDLFEPTLRQVIDTGHPLAVFADMFPWDVLEKEYSSLYSDKGAPAKPVRLMAGLLILKMVFEGSDHGIVSEWPRDPYFQYLCGGNIPVGKPPCSSSDLSRFRKRIGIERIADLKKLSERYMKEAGTGRIRVQGNYKPGDEKFCYSVRLSLYDKFINNFKALRQVARKLFSPAGLAGR
jgi:hypothetical protein